MIKAIAKSRPKIFNQIFNRCLLTLTCGMKEGKTGTPSQGKLTSGPAFLIQANMPTLHCGKVLGTNNQGLENHLESHGGLNDSSLVFARAGRPSTPYSRQWIRSDRSRRAITKNSVFSWRLMSQMRLTPRAGKT